HLAAHGRGLLQHVARRGDAAADANAQDQDQRPDHGPPTSSHVRLLGSEPSAALPRGYAPAPTARSDRAVRPPCLHRLPDCPPRREPTLSPCGPSRSARLPPLRWAITTPTVCEPY